MDAQTAKDIYALLLSISGVIISLLVAASVYFLKRIIDAVSSLDVTVATLATSIAILNKTNESNDEICDLTHKQIDHEIEGLNDRVKEIENKCIKRVRGGKRPCPTE